MDLEHAERDEELGLEPAAQPAVAWSWEHWDERNLPVEPASSAPAGDDAKRLQDLRAFHLYGRRPSDAAAPAPAGTLPALLHRYRDLSRVRHAYPLCVNRSDHGVRTLSEWTDEFLAAQAREGEAAEQLKRNLYRLESMVRSLAAEHDGECLSVLWDRAAATMLETSNAPGDSEALLREHIALVRAAKPGDIDVVGCGPHTALRLLRASASASWRRRCEGWSDELDALIRGVQNVLAADFSHSDAARSPRHLEQSLGAVDDELDAGAMSNLLASAPRESALEPARRERIESVLSRLTGMQPVFAAEGADSPSIRHDAVFNDAESAVAEARRRSSLMTDFFRAVRIARLEVQNRYRADMHDPFFAGFDERYLTAEERSLCPPVLVHLSGDAFPRAEIGSLLAVLNAGDAIKVLVELPSLYRANGSAAFPEVHVSGAARLAGMAMALNHAYVLQAPLSDATVLRAAMVDGIDFTGPALFSVYAPGPGSDATGATYLRAAAAAESRFFPLLVFHPGRGETAAERVDITANPQPAVRWPRSMFAFRNAAGEEAAAEISFTPAEFLFCDRRLAGLFWPADASRWHDSMIPVHEYLEMTPEQAAGRIPYLLTVDRDGHIERTVVARPVIETARQCRAFWRSVQESGGIENSFAARALDDERERLAADKEREIQAIEKNYLAQLDQDVGELTREIVQRIAAQLLGAGTIAYSAGAGSVAVPAAPKPAAAPASAQAAAAPPAAEAEEEAAASFDDPYIDTPLCTSCNECTQLNSRLFGYNGNKQAEIKDATAGPFSDLVRAAELCPVHIIHPGKPKDPGEAGLADWVARAAKFN